jgi:pyridoxine 5-phosphate synthase
MIYLGVNIDHVATLRNARGGADPDPLTAALLAETHGADGITAHLREDRRHMKDADLMRLKHGIKTRLNLEMAATEEMLEIALNLRPYMVTIVPERRQELTTEGGLNVIAIEDPLTKMVSILKNKGILVSLFVEADRKQLEASARSGATIVELHTGEYAEAFHRKNPEKSLERLIQGAQFAKEQLGLEINAGHGLTYDNVKPVLSLPGLVELNIGHNIIARAVFQGLGPAVAEMKNRLQSQGPSTPFP